MPSDETPIDTTPETATNPEENPQDNADDAPNGDGEAPKKKRRRRRGGRGRRKPAGEGAETTNDASASDNSDAKPEASSERSDAGSGDDQPKKKRRRRRSGRGNREDEAPRDEEAPVRTDPNALDAEDFAKKRVSAVGADPAIFDQDRTFADFGFKDELVAGLTEAGFERPTHIQSQLMPEVLAGKDMLGQAKTGTGKTAAFALPMLNMIEAGEAMSGLILVPTRELAIQVSADVRQLGAKLGVGVVAVYGGQKINVQADRLREGREIVVATPGRLQDMAERRMFSYRDVRMVVLDEVDRMLDIGFREDIKKILSRCPKDRQTVFVSATISPEIERLARKYSKPDAEKIVTTAGSLTAELVQQHYFAVEAWDKPRLLTHLLTHEEPALTVVFCRMKRTVDNLAKKVSAAGIEAHAIHGDMVQGKRDRVMQKLRQGGLKVLIASDLAARGLDVDGITHVINYDLPEDPDVYVHRIGRTARAGRGGHAWSFVEPAQGDLLTEIELLVNAHVPKMEYPDFEGSPPPRSVVEAREADARRREELKSQNRFNAPEIKAPDKVDESKFPGGMAPTKMPPKRMHGRMRPRR